MERRAGEGWRTIESNMKGQRGRERERWRKNELERDGH